jgi:hypothetical protein
MVLVAYIYDIIADIRNEWGNGCAENRHNLQKVQERHVSGVASDTLGIADLGPVPGNFEQDCARKATRQRRSLTSTSEEERE